MTRRQVNRTLLLVGEGDTEKAFLQHVKEIYAPRGCGLVVTVKNARGKGAKHVIEQTIKWTYTGAYDSVAVLLDTDTDWSPQVVKKAKSVQIVVLTSEPCFEAMMLRVAGENLATTTNSSELKEQFSPLVRDPLSKNSYKDRFGQNVLEKARCREKTIENLLALFKFSVPANRKKR